MKKILCVILLWVVFTCVLPLESRASVSDVRSQSIGSFGKRYAYLIPSDATLDEYDAKRFAIVSGKVVSTDGDSLSGVRVTIHNHPEYGSVLSDVEGKYLFPVEGGGRLTVICEADGLFKAHRRVRVPWNDIVVADLVKMVPQERASRLKKKSVKAAALCGGKTETVTTFRSRKTTDHAGSRACTVVLKSNAGAYAVSKGKKSGLDTETSTLSAVEYTTPEAMPAQLPAKSAFTYCVDLTMNNEEHVEFDQPAVTWVENFLGFDVGEPVPAGYYDPDKAVWVPSDNGVVVRLLDTDADGVTDAIDADGDDLPDDLDGDGSFSDESEGLSDAAYYPPGATFWRVMLPHFSAWDFNWPYGPPMGAV